MDNWARRCWGAARTFLVALNFLVLAGLCSWVYCGTSFLGQGLYPESRVCRQGWNTVRELSSGLLAAQKAASRVPFLKAVASNKLAGVVRLKWEKLYSGSEPDCYHSATIPGDGSLIRVRVSPGDDNNKLYRQRVVNPGLSSDFSSWIYSGQYDCQAVTAASHNNEVGIFWVNLNQELKCMMSSDYGATWASAVTLDYSPYATTEGISAAYRSNGDVAIFFVAENVLFVKMRVNSIWQEKTAWDKTTGYLTSVAAFFDTNWDLLVTGRDTSGNYKLWSLIFDGSSWSQLKELDSTPAGGNYEFRSIYQDKTEVFYCFFVEKFIGVEPYNLPHWTSTVPGTEFLSNLWREPVPFDTACEYGLAVAHYASFCWLSSPNSVWRACIEEQTLELTVDVANTRLELIDTVGKLTLELQNGNGKYNLPGTDSLLTLDTGCQIDISPGYVTSQGAEASDGLSFWIDGYEHISAGGKASLVLHAGDGWLLLDKWRARHQFRWNQDTPETSIKQILEFILSRVGLKLVVKSQSTQITEFCPDFTIHPGDVGTALVTRLVSYVPDLLYMEGINAVLVYPQESDSSDYSYGQSHVIFRGKYLNGSLQVNQIRVEGYDEETHSPIVVDSFDWQQMEKFPERFLLVVDRNIGSALQTHDFGETLLRKYAMEALKGAIQIPVNCGQQLYDIIDITDVKVGLSETKKRVVGIALEYQPAKSIYMQVLSLGGV